MANDEIIKQLERRVAELEDQFAQFLLLPSAVAQLFARDDSESAAKAVVPLSDAGASAIESGRDDAVAHRQHVAATSTPDRA